jgi:hypothetical protein
MRTTWEKIIKYVSSAYSNGISTELRTRKTLVFDPPQHSQAVLDEHIELEKLRKIQILGHIITGIRTDLKSLKNTPGHSARVAVELKNEIESITCAMAKDKPITLEGDDKTAWENQWQNHQEHDQALVKHRGQVFGLIRGQCTQTLLDKMEHDPRWSTTTDSGDPLLMYLLIDARSWPKLRRPTPSQSYGSTSAACTASNRNASPTHSGTSSLSPW